MLYIKPIIAFEIEKWRERSRLGLRKEREMGEVSERIREENRNREKSLIIVNDLGRFLLISKFLFILLWSYDCLTQLQLTEEKTILLME